MNKLEKNTFEHTTVDTTEKKIGLLRRTGALIYDCIAAVTLLYFAAFVPVLATGATLVPGNPFFFAYLLTILFFYFFVTWRRGRTLGMQVWKIQITNTDGDRPNAKQCMVRFIGAAFSISFFGLGYISALLNAERSTWHDRLSSTRLTKL